MNIELLTITPDCEYVIERAGRICYNSKMGDPTIIQRWIKSGHESVIEHGVVSFIVSDVSRSESHQHVRHRIASFAQVSQRYVDEYGFNYVMPPSIKDNVKAEEIFIECMEHIQSAYDELTTLGIKKEDARFVLPNACTTKFAVTMNFRELRSFFKLRRDSHAQWEIREVANKMLEIVKPYAPNVFFDMWV